MDAAVNFIAFATDSRVILWTLAAFTFGGILGMYLEAWRLTIDRQAQDERLAESHNTGWAADEEEPTVTAARRVA